MRFLAFAVISQVWGAPTCSTSGVNTFMETDAEWYRAILFCAFTGAYANPLDFYPCLSGLGTADGSTSPNTDMAASLIAGLNVATRADIVSDCHKCAFDFALAANAAFTDGLTGDDLIDYCKNGGGDTTADSVQLSECQWGLYKAITAFNTCSGNGLDIVTRAVSTRCTIEEFTNFAIAHNPLSSIAQCAFEDTALTTVHGISNCVGSSFVADKKKLKCGSCFDPLIVSIQGISTTCGDEEDLFDYDTCDPIGQFLEPFGQCTGGLVVANTGAKRCSKDQMRVIAPMRPYTQIMHCVYSGFATGLCLDAFNSVRIVVDTLSDDTVCSEYFADLVVDLATSAPAICESSPFSPECTAVIGMVYNDLYTAQTLIGMRIDTSSTTCSSAQWAAMIDSEKSYIPFVRCGMKATSVTAVLDCVESDSLVASLLTNVACASCFKQLALETFVARSKDVSGLTGVACVDPYSEGCVLALSNPMRFFNACTGFEAKIISNSECSSDAQESLEINNAGIAKVLELVAHSASATEAIYKYSQISGDLNASEIPCMDCYLDLISPLFSLPESNACLSDITSWDCYMLLGPVLDNFYRCSRGWSSNATTVPEVQFIT